MLIGLGLVIEEVSGSWRSGEGWSFVKEGTKASQAD